MYNSKASDYQTTEYRGYRITSYLAKGSYGHRRISKIVDQNGKPQDLHKLAGWLDGRAFNVGFSHSDCEKYAAMRIDHMLDGEDSEIGRQLKWRRENPYRLY